jgi:Uma2 family endonuclease
MTPTLTKKLLTAIEFAHLPAPGDGSRQELVRGEVVAMPPPGFIHGIVQLNIGSALKVFARQTRCGRVATETAVITERDPDTVRGPDILFWSYQRLPADQTPAVYANEPADLVVEVRSPNETAGQIALKVSEYFASGVRFVWLVDPEERTVAVYHQADDAKVLQQDAIITGSDVLPGFSCPVADFFADI